MLVLFETPAGYAIFKLLDEKKLQQSENLYKDFENPATASKVVKLKHFEKFNDTTEALAAATAAVEGKMGKSLKKMLKKVVAKDIHQQLAVSDAKLGNVIKEKLNIGCIASTAVQELMRGIRNQANNLITGLSDKEMSAMALGLAHSLSRYKLKFSPDKVDTMIVQAISLLDDLDKELNNYVMRCREWYGWHFPELGKIISDNLAFARTVKTMGVRENAFKVDLSEVLPEEVEEEVKAAAEISMGTEISEEDIENIKFLCEQIIEIADYRAQLYDYIKNRMMAIAPNLTILVGELVGARLIAHAGSLLNLAKHPSSTVQILGAEKALFRALKTKHDTPKYGLIFHASLVGQTNPKNKGKISRMLAAKASLAARVDALGEDVGTDMAIENKAMLESRLKMFEDDQMRRISGTGKKKARADKYENKSQVKSYNPAADSTIEGPLSKRKHEEEQQSDNEKKSKKLKVKHKEVEVKQKVEEEIEEEESQEVTQNGAESAKKMKKKKKKEKKEKMKIKTEDSDEVQEKSTMSPDESGEKKKKKKKKKKKTLDDEE